MYDEKFQNTRLVPPQTLQGGAPPAEAKFRPKTPENVYAPPAWRFARLIRSKTSYSTTKLNNSTMRNSKIHIWYQNNIYRVCTTCRGKIRHQDPGKRICTTCLAVSRLIRSKTSYSITKLNNSTMRNSKIHIWYQNNIYRVCTTCRGKIRHQDARKRICTTCLAVSPANKE